MNVELQAHLGQFNQSMQASPIFEWYVVCSGSKSRFQEDICKKIGLHAHNTITIPDSKVNVIGVNMYECLMGTRIFTLIMNNIFIQAFKIMKKAATSLICQPSFIDRMFHILGEMG